MAKRKKKSKVVQKRAKMRRGNSAKRGKTRKSAGAKAAKRTIAKAKQRGATAKKAAPKEVRTMKKPVVETVVVDVIEEPAPGVITVTEIEETRQVN